MKGRLTNRMKEMIRRLDGQADEFGHGRTESTIRALRRRGLVTGCFEVLALTGAGRALVRELAPDEARELGDE